MKLKPGQIMYVASMGKLLRVTAVFDNAKDANAHMSKSNDGVVAEFGRFVILADLHDKGIKREGGL